MTDHISDRELERLALGELDEADANALLERLTATDQMHRFEALIADDEEFHAAHPPALLAAQVREEVRRRARTRHKPTPPLYSLRPIALATAVFAVAVIVAFFVSRGQPNGPVEPIAVANDTTPDPAQTNLAAVAPDDGEPADDDDDEPRTRFELQLIEGEFVFRMPQTLYLAVGEVATLPARGVRRVGISNSSVGDAVSDDTKFYFTAKAPGRTILTATVGEEGDRRSRSVLVVVGEPLPQKQLEAAAGTTLSECVATQEAAVLVLQVVAQEAGVFVGHAHLEGQELSRDLRGCVDDVVGNWDLNPKDLSVGTLRYNLATTR